MAYPEVASEPVSLDEVLFRSLSVIAIICTLAVSLFLGTEYSDGTLRNKLVVGRTRAEIYLANLTVCTACSFLLLLCALAGAGPVGYALYGGTQMELPQLAFVLLCAFLAVAAQTALCVLVAMNIGSKSTAVVTAMVLLLAMLFTASFLGSRLMEPELVYDGVTITQDGIEYGDLIPNSAFVDGAERTAYELIYDSLPVGQMARINNLELERCLRWPWLSLLWQILSSVAGLALFARKDLK